MTAAASLDRFFAAGLGSTKMPQRLSLFTTESLIAWLAHDGLEIADASRFPSPAPLGLRQPEQEDEGGEGGEGVRGF